MFIQWIKSCSIKTGKVKSEKGFTLLELILVLVVISILSSSLVMPFLSILNEGTKGDIHATAAQLAAADIEDLRGQTFANINAGPNPSAIVTTTINDRSYERQFTHVQVDSTLTTPDASGKYIMVQATVTETVSNPDVSVTLTGVISEDFN